MNGRWRFRPRHRASEPTVDEHPIPSPKVSQKVDSEGPTSIAGRDQATINIDQVVNLNISLAHLEQLLRQWPDAAPSVHEVASEAHLSGSGKFLAEDLLRHLARLDNTPPDELPPIVKVGERVRQSTGDQEMRDAFGSVAEEFAAREPARRESLENLRRESSESSDALPGDSCLLIVLDPDNYSIDRYRLSIVLYRNGRDGDRQDEDDTAITIEEIEARLRAVAPGAFPDVPRPASRRVCGSARTAWYSLRPVVHPESAGWPSR